MTHKCPACERGRLEDRIGDRKIEYGEQELVVRGLHHAECDYCGEEVVLPEHRKLNAVIYSDAKKESEGLLSCEAIKHLREKWNLSQHEASSVFGGGLNAFSKYERGEIVHSKSMDLLMRVFDKVGLARSFLMTKAGLNCPVDAMSEQAAWVTEIQAESLPAGAFKLSGLEYTQAVFPLVKQGQDDWQSANDAWDYHIPLHAAAGR
ncbi:type II toxin-antitoxin system MqsA family antitoxin [Xanthomonas euvesicatoria pv. physalidis]|uniref:type II toxin-antitoxin system MqsA family antitoxin n=1 Tax=Xanthomonas euvesicatoria TaxID=456327 RepID=UPI001C476299|nr:type II toxin-antitoxin system MqsA family antitoxin [Xanthomonas euvesicatoria]MBV6687371.1 type II toxin-antitoxin system MqsA family antitoxin [Xanthomonas euvesicatoria pv. physalidis]